MPVICNSIVVEAPLATTFEISNRLESWPDIMPEYKKVEVFKQEGKKKWFHLVHESGAEWTSWRVLHSKASFAYAERHEPKLPFKFMHITWTYKEIDARQTEMTWEMSFELPKDCTDLEQHWVDSLTEHTYINQAKMKAYIEARAEASSRTGLQSGGTASTGLPIQ